MKYIFLFVFIFSNHLYAASKDWPTNLSEIFVHMGEVPFLHEQNRLHYPGNINEFKKIYYKAYDKKGHGVVGYEAVLPSAECDDVDRFVINLYFHKQEVRFAMPIRNYGCHED